MGSSFKFIKNKLSSPVEYFGKVTTTLSRTTLKQLTIGSVGKVIGTW